MVCFNSRITGFSHLSMLLLLELSMFSIYHHSDKRRIKVAKCDYLRENLVVIKMDMHIIILQNVTSTCLCYVCATIKQSVLLLYYRGEHNLIQSVLFSP